MFAPIYFAPIFDAPIYFAPGGSDVVLSVIRPPLGTTAVVGGTTGGVAVALMTVGVDGGRHTTARRGGGTTGVPSTRTTTRG